MYLKVFLFLFPLLSVQVNALFSAESRKIYEDGYLTTMELIKKYDHVGENYTVVTSDGYILSVFRMLPNEKVCAGKYPKKQPVLLLHGIEGSSGAFVVPGPTRGLAFRLSDECFDVWMINYRGSKYSQEHMNLTTKNRKYWNFSFHELGIYDNVDVMRFVLNATGAEKLLCICHSQGCTSLLVTTSLLPEFTQEKVTAILAMSPVSFIGHLKSKLMKKYAKELEKIPYGGALAGSKEFTQPCRVMLQNLLKLICSDEFKFMQQKVCEPYFWITNGKDLDQLNTTIFPVFIGHFLEGSSQKEFIHYAQLVTSEQFRQYDYGIAENMKRYNSTTPPNYPLGKSNTPIALWHGNNDILNSKEDFELLVSQLPNVIGKYYVRHDKWNHLDFIIAKDVETYLYVDLFRVLAQF